MNFTDEKVRIITAAANFIKNKRRCIRYETNVYSSKANIELGAKFLPSTLELLFKVLLKPVASKMFSNQKQFLYMYLSVILKIFYILILLLLFFFKKHAKIKTKQSQREDANSNALFIFQNIHLKKVFFCLLHKITAKHRQKCRCTLIFKSPYMDRNWKFLCFYTWLSRPLCFRVCLVKYEKILLHLMCFTRLALALVFIFQVGRKKNYLNTLWKMKLSQMIVKLKKELNRKVYLQQEDLPGNISYKFI